MKPHQGSILRSHGIARAGQRGVVLFIALIVLVAMMLAGIALYRAVGSGILIAGNLSFKRAATSQADFGIEAGRNWLITASSAALAATSPVDGYYAQWSQFDPLTATWDNSNSRLFIDPTNGDEIRYVIHRLCENVGPEDPATCLVAAAASGGSTKAAFGFGGGPMGALGKVYYRVTARIQGVKNTVSFVQTVMN